MRWRERENEWTSCRCSGIYESIPASLEDEDMNLGVDAECRWAIWMGTGTGVDGWMDGGGCNAMQCDVM